MLSLQGMFHSWTVPRTVLVGVSAVCIRSTVSTVKVYVVVPGLVVHVPSPWGMVHCQGKGNLTMTAQPHLPDPSCESVG